MSKHARDLIQWEKYADLYHAGKGLAGDDIHNDLIRPILDDFLGKDFSGQTILDAGWGYGFLSYRLARSAKKVIGIDVPEKLLQYANENKKRNNVSFEKADMTKNCLFEIVNLISWCVSWACNTCLKLRVLFPRAQGYSRRGESSLL
jgi:2-polyprenyl-3-methyl-5-hydroxy-6-metoxy-1,4-benzoquinol methylase